MKGCEELKHTDEKEDCHLVVSGDVAARGAALNTMTEP